MNKVNPALDKAFELLTAFLKEPTASYPCVTSLTCAFELISQEWEATASEARRLKMARSRPQLLRAAIRFMTLDLSSAERVEILKALTKCENCYLCRVSPLRDGCPGAGEEPMDHVFHCVIYPAVSITIQLLTCVLSGLTQNKFRNPKEDTTARKPDVQPWPLCPEDLLPNGLKTSVKALEFWAKPEYTDEIDAISTVLKFAGALANFYPPFGRELLQPPYTLIVKIPIQHMEDCINGTVTRGSVALFFEIDPVLARSDRDEWVKLLLANRDLLLSAFERLASHVSTFPPSELETRDPTLTLLKGYLEMLKSEAIVDRRTGKISFNPAHLVEFEKGQDKYHDLGSSYLGLAQVRREGCYNFSCPGGNGGALRLCSQCDLFRYCGPKCQKEAWKHPEYPHKDACIMVCLLRKLLGPDTWSQLWTPGSDSKKFEDACLAKKIDREFVKYVGERVMFLSSMKARLRA